MAYNLGVGPDCCEWYFCFAVNGGGTLGGEWDSCYVYLIISGIQGHYRRMASTHQL